MVGVATPPLAGMVAGSEHRENKPSDSIHSVYPAT